MSTTSQQPQVQPTVPHLYPEDEQGITKKEKYMRMFKRLATEGLDDSELEEAATFPGGADALRQNLLLITLVTHALAKPDDRT